MLRYFLVSPRLTVCLLLTVVAVLGASLFSARAVGGTDKPEFTNATALLTTNRAGLRVCVQSLVPGIDSRTVQGQVRGALNQVSNHPDFRPAGLARQPVVVDAGCPAAPAIDNPQFNPLDRASAGVPVDTPSPYRLFVFVAPADRLAHAFTWQPRLLPQELLCDSSRVCPEVTTAAYLAPTELTNQPVLEETLTHGVGLWPVGKPRFNPNPAPHPPTRGTTGTPTSKGTPGSR